MRTNALLILVLAGTLALGAGGQTTAWLPSNTPTSGACNTIPFAFVNETYMIVIPAATMAAAGGAILDVGITGCGAGTWSAPLAMLGAGHVPAPPPIPFMYPSFDSMGNVSTLGSFQDFTVLYATQSSGTLVWPVRQHAWSPVGGLSNVLAWNGVDDVGLYLSYQGGTAANWSGQAHSDGSVFRTWAGGFQAAQSTNTTTTGGLKLIINPTPRLRVDLSASGGFTTYAVSHVPMAASEGWTLISLSVAGPLGGGSLLGLDADLLTWQTIFAQPIALPGHPFHWVAGVPGLFPSVPLSFPSPPGLAGQTWDFVSLGLGPSLALLDVSGVERHVW